MCTSCSSVKIKSIPRRLLPACSLPLTPNSSPPVSLESHDLTIELDGQMNV